MHETDATAFWALMFLRFHGLGQRDASRFIGEFLAARYDETAAPSPPEMDALLARLEAAEHPRAPAEPGDAVEPVRSPG